MSNYKTVSELLRECAEADFPLTAIEKKLGCSGVTLGETVNLLADEIDREKRAIYEAQMDSTGYGTSPHHIIKAYAESIGKPMNGDCITDWMNRYYLPRPMFEDGEPVHDSDLEEIGSLATCCVYTDGSWRFDPDKFEDEGNPKHWDKQRGRQCDRIRRPKPQVLDADGVPTEVGDTVWHVSGDAQGTVQWFNDPDKSSYFIKVAWTNGNEGNYMPDALTHREPDTQGRIDRDALKSTCDYFGSSEKPCSECPYDTKNCLIEMRLDLLRRQRELDGRDA